MSILNTRRCWWWVDGGEAGSPHLVRLPWEFKDSRKGQRRPVLEKSDCALLEGRLSLFYSPLFSQCLAHSRILISISCFLRPSVIVGNETTGFDNSKEESITFLQGEMLRGLRIWKMVPTINFYSLTICTVGWKEARGSLLPELHGSSLLRSSTSEPKGFLLHSLLNTE